MRPGQLLVEKCRERPLVDGGGERLLADRRRMRGSKNQPPTLPFSRPAARCDRHQLDLIGVVLEGRSDLAPSSSSCL